MSDSESERQRKLKAGRAKLMEFKQMKKKKKKEQAAAAQSGASSKNASRSESQSVREHSQAASNDRSNHGDEDTENDAVSISSAADSHPASPIPHEGENNSYTSGSEYTSADESYSYSTEDGGVDSLVVANLERNELKSRVIELEENLRGKQAVLKELNKENFELRAKLHNYESVKRQESSPSPVLKRELDSLQETLRNNQKRLEEISLENHEIRAKLTQTGHEDKSVTSKIEELKVSLESKQEMLQALNAQNEELAKENRKLKAKMKDTSPDASQSDSQIESLQENLKMKQSILSELNKQNEELREKIEDLSKAPGLTKQQTEQYERKITDLQSELTFKDDELEKLRAIQVSFLQTKEVLKEMSLQSQKEKQDFANLQSKYATLQKDSLANEEELKRRASSSENQLETLQTEYHNIVAINNDSLMKIQILESQIADINNLLDQKDGKIKEMDIQISLAIGERDAVQLEARTQVEDFEERIKAMHDQLQTNDSTLREYEVRISHASEELLKTRELVDESRRILEDKDSEIFSLRKDLDALQGNEDTYAKDRAFYQEEIQNFKMQLEVKQKDFDNLNSHLNEMKVQNNDVIMDKDEKIQELERKVSETEKFHIMEFERLQTEFSEALEIERSKNDESFRKEKEILEMELSRKVSELEDDKRKMAEELKVVTAEEQRMESSVEVEMKLQKASDEKLQEFEKLNADLEGCRIKIDELETMLSEKKNELDSVQEVVEEKEIRISDLERQVDEDVKNTTETKDLELKEKIAEILELEHVVAELKDQVTMSEDNVEKLRMKNESLVEDLRAIEHKVDDEKAQLEGDYQEKLRVVEMELADLKAQMTDDATDGSNLIEENRELRELVEKQAGNENQLTKQLSDLQEHNTRVTKEQNDAIARIEEMTMEEQSLKDSLEKTVNEKEALQERLDDLQQSKTELSDVRTELQLLQEANSSLKEKIEKYSENENILMETAKKLTEERDELCTEYEAEISMLKERLELVSNEHNAETVAMYDQNMRTLEKEKDEQIKTLKEEISHLKEGLEKQLSKLRVEYENDSKQLEEENQKLRADLKSLQEKNERELSSIDNSAKMTVEQEKEKHKLEMKNLRDNLTKYFENERLQLKESFWKQLKKNEMDRELEMKLILEDYERKKNEELDMLREELVEEKNTEIHDVVCNMTKESKENAALLREKLEKQLADVQAERDEELRTIQEEYQSYKERKKDEMEDMVTSQMAKYQEEQSTLYKRLNEAEEHVHLLSKEREEILSELSRKDIDVKKEKEARTVVEEELVSVKQGKKALQSIMNAMHSDLQIVSHQDTNRLHELKEKILVEADDCLVKDNLQESSFEESLNSESARSLDEELKNVARLCKEQIVELAEKLSIVAGRAKNSEKECGELSFLNRTLNEEVKRMETELRANKEDLNKTYEMNESLKEQIIVMNADFENLKFDSGRKEEIINEDNIVKETAIEKDDLEDLNGDIAELRGIESREEINPVPGPKSSEMVSQAASQQELIVVEELVEVKTCSVQEMIAPEFLAEPEIDQLTTASDAHFEEEGEDVSGRDMEMKHLQNLLIEQNNKLETQKQELKELHEALENERLLFAEQLRARQTKEAETKSTNEDISLDVVLQERRKLASKVVTLEQRLKEKEKTENDLKDENWKLVNLLKDNNMELFTEKESLQDQLIKQEEIIQELQQQMSTSDVVTREIQEAFGRQLAALHRQRDSLLQQLEQHKREHQGYAKIIQEKATLEDRLREEKILLSEKLRQKEELELELAEERAALHEKLTELEKLREKLNGKDKLAMELTDQRDELKMELMAIEERLNHTEANLSVERAELEREIALKDSELRQWEEDFRSRELDFVDHEESLKQNFKSVLDATRTDFESRNEENLRQLRIDLDDDYSERMNVLESGLHNQYGQQLTRLKEEHQEQMNRAKSGFEEKLHDLRRQLDEERLRQVGTIKNVLEREHSKEMMDLETGHENEVDQLRKELQEQHQIEIENLRRNFEVAHHNALEDLQASLLAESSIQLAAAKLQAEKDAERQLEKLHREISEKVDGRLDKMKIEKKKSIGETSRKCSKTAKDRMDDVISEMKLKQSASSENLADSSSDVLEAKIKSLEEQLMSSHHEELKQAEIELALRYEKEMEKLKIEVTEQHGEDMFLVMSEFEAEQERYFKERLQYLQQEHDNEMDQLRQEYELLLLKARNDFDSLRDDDFQRIRRLQDEIYAREETIVEMRKNFDLEKGVIEKQMEQRVGAPRQIDPDEIQTLEMHHQQEIFELRANFEKELIDKDFDFEEKYQELRAYYEAEMLNKAMDYAKKEEEWKKEQEKRDLEYSEKLQENIQRIEANYDDQLKAQDEKHRDELEEAVIQLSSNLKSDFNNVMADMKSRLDAEKEEVRNECFEEKNRELNELENRLRSEFDAEVRTRMDGEIEMVKKECMEEKNREIQELRSQLWTELELEMKSVMDDEIEIVKKECMEEKNREIQELRSQLRAELELEMKSVMDKEIEMVKKECMEEKNRELQELRSQLRAELDLEMKSEMDKEIEMVKKECMEEKNRELQELRSQLRAELDLEMKSEMDKEIEMVKKECMEEKNRELQELRCQLKSEFDSEMTKKPNRENEEIKCERVEELRTEPDNLSYQITPEFQNGLMGADDSTTLQRDCCKDKARALEELQDALTSEYEAKIADVRNECELQRVNELAQITTQLSLRNAVELENQRKEMHKEYEDNLELFKQEMQQDFSKNALRQAGKIEEMEMKHTDELRRAKLRYDRIVRDRTQELQAEVHILRTLLEGMDSRPKIAPQNFPVARMHSRDPTMDKIEIVQPVQTGAKGVPGKPTEGNKFQNTGTGGIKGSHDVVDAGHIPRRHSLEDIRTNRPTRAASYDPIFPGNPPRGRSVDDLGMGRRMQAVPQEPQSPKKPPRGVFLEDMRTDATIQAESQEFLTARNSLEDLGTNRPILAESQEFLTPGKPARGRSLEDVGRDRPIYAESQEFLVPGKPSGFRSLEDIGRDRPIYAESQEFLVPGKPPRGRSLENVGGDGPIYPASQGLLTAGRPSRARSAEHIRTVNTPGTNAGMDMEDNATLASSTETLIARFADGHVENVLRDVQDVASTESGSQYGSSFAGSAPSLFYPPDVHFTAGQRSEGPEVYDQAQRERESLLTGMRQRYRTSESESGASYDQLMEAPMVEDEERFNRLLREKEEMRERLITQQMESDRIYQGKIQELEYAYMQHEDYIQRLHHQHQQELDALKSKFMMLAEENIKELRAENEKEKASIVKDDEEKLVTAKSELSAKHEKLIEKFVKKQEKELSELNNDHIEELAMLKHELNSKHERALKELSEKQSMYVLETRERYEKLLKDERDKYEKRHAEDAKKLRQAADKDLGDKQQTLVKMMQEQYESDLRKYKEDAASDTRKVVDELTKDHMVEMERAKENLRRDLTEKYSLDIDLAREHARKEFELEHLHNLRILENDLEETHIKQLQTLQDIKEKHKTNIDDLKRDHQKQIENLEKENEEKIKAIKTELNGEHVDQINAVDLNAESQLQKAKSELEEAHKKETEELQNELATAKSRIVALEAMKSGTESTYIETINSLQEDYENEIKKLRETVEKIKRNQVENMDKAHLDIENTDQRIIKQNFEQQMSQMKQHYELLMNELGRGFEQNRKESLEDQAAKYEKKLEDLVTVYHKDREVLADEIFHLGQERKKEVDALQEKIKNMKSETEGLEKKCKELKDENVSMKNKVQVTDDQYNTLVARHERQEQENTKYIEMIKSDIGKCEKEKSNLKKTNNRLLQILSDAVRASMLTEELISRHLDGLIQETSRTESGVDISGLRAGARPGRHQHDADRSFRGSPGNSKKAHGVSFADETQYSNLSEGSLLSDEGLELSLLSRENLFPGPDLDAHGEEMVRGVGERLHTAVDHVLKMLSMSTKQTTETRHSYEEMAARSSGAEMEQRQLRERIAEELKTALENLEKEQKLKDDWEKDARKKHSENMMLKKQVEELKQETEALSNEKVKKDDEYKELEERFLEIEAERGILEKLNHDLELKLAELKTHREKDAHDLTQENESLKARLARAIQLSGDEFDEVVAEIENLRENVVALSDDKESLKSQVHAVKEKLADSGEENSKLRENISDILQSNIELIQQNEALKGKILSLESAFEETLEEQKIAQDKAGLTTVDFTDFGKSPSQDIIGDEQGKIPSLQQEVVSLKASVDQLKQENENLTQNLEEKVQYELELVKKISELENELYKSANEVFELERDDLERFVKEKKNIDAKMKKLTAENGKLVEELETKNEEILTLKDDLSKAKDLVTDRSSLYEELMKMKSSFLVKEKEFSEISHDSDVAKQALLDKEEQLSVVSSELSELKETIADQQSTINSQHSKIVDLLQKQSSDELNQQYIKQLEEQINQEKDMLLEKDSEIQNLLVRLSEQRDEGDGEDAQTKAKRVEELEDKLKTQEIEIEQLKTVADAANNERQQLEQVYEVNLQKTIRHLKVEMEQIQQAQIARLREEHQAEMDRILEMSKLDFTDLGQKFEEQIGAAERVNIQLLEHFFKNRTLNESQAPSMDDNAPVQSLLNELQSEAEKIAQLVTSYDSNENPTGNIEQLQKAWIKEKDVLLEAVKALRELVSRASGAAAADSRKSGEDWRATLLESIQEVFKYEHGLLSAELETLETFTLIKNLSPEVIAERRRMLAEQNEYQKAVLDSLNNQDRESLLSEISHLRSNLDELQQEVLKYSQMLKEVQEKTKVRESTLDRQLHAQASLVEQERTASTQLRTQLEAEKNRNSELEEVINHERIVLSDLKTVITTDEEKINDLVSSLENERRELNEIRILMTEEQSQSEKLKKQLKKEQKKAEELREELSTERKHVEEMSSREKSNLQQLESLLSGEDDKKQHLMEMVEDLTEERNRLLQAAELEKNHTKKIEELCEDLKIKATNEKSERQKLEKITERYHANLEEITKLFEAEKQRRVEKENDLNEERRQKMEVIEKGQQDAQVNEKLRENLQNATNGTESLKEDLERANLRLSSLDAELKSENAIKLAELEKQNAERMKEVVERTRRSAADEVDRERATCKQLREALNALQLKYETSKSKLERLQDSAVERNGDLSDKEAKTKTSPIGQFSVSSRVMDPFIGRCNRLVLHCQNVVTKEQQRLSHDSDRPSARAFKELQSTHDSLAALLQELNDLQKDLRALEQGDHTASSPLARLEQAHNKNEELRDHIRKLVKEKSELRGTLASLEEKIMEYRNREEELEKAAQFASDEAKSFLKKEQLKWQNEKETIEHALKMASVENANLRNGQFQPETESREDENKLSDSGWTINKIQKLYGRCLRAESFRKALIYQKKYLLFLLGGFQETEAITLSMIAKMDDIGPTDHAVKTQYGKSRAFMRFRTAARVVVATWRMKFLVKKWNRSVSKASGRSTKRSGEHKTGAPSLVDGAKERNVSPDKFVFSNASSLGQHGEGRRSETRSSGSERIKYHSDRSTESDHRSRDMTTYRTKNGTHGYDRQSKRPIMNGKTKFNSRVEHQEPTEITNGLSNYSNIRNLDRSPPRAYPRPASPRLSRDPSDVYAESRVGQHLSRVRSPMSQASSPRHTEDFNSHRRSLSANGLEETNTSLNAYIKKLESLQARLKSQ